MPIGCIQYRIYIGIFSNAYLFFRKSLKCNKYNRTSHRRARPATLFLIFILAIYGCNPLSQSCSYSRSKQLSHNRIMKAKNGNIVIKNYKLKICHVNKGNSLFKNKIPEIRNIIDEHSPDILCVSEANVVDDLNIYAHDFSDYNFELNMMHMSYSISRNIILIKRGISYHIRPDLENPITCTIWIELFLDKNKKILIMGGYRQWKLPAIVDPDNNKNKDKKQLQRLGLIIEKWEDALKEGKHTIVAMDDNIDTNINAKHNKIYKIENLAAMLRDHLEDKGLITHNNELTRFQQNQDPSCIDHLYSNCPRNISNVITHKNLFSDHSLISLIYNTKSKFYTPKFTNVRNFKLLSRERMLLFLDNSIELNKIFNYTDPEVIANIMQIELNAMINIIAPCKRIQIKKNYQGYLTESTREKIKLNKYYLGEAIKINNAESWRIFRHNRNSLSKVLRNEKRSYIESKLNSNKDKWKTLKEINGVKKAPPQIVSNIKTRS